MEETILYAGYTYMGILVWDDIESVDFLCSLPEVDRDRIGCVGLSMGGYRSVWLGAMDERIKCCCPVGYMARFDDLAPHRQPGFWAVVPGLYNRLTYPDLASLIVPRNLLILNCQNDHTFDLSSIEKAIDIISAVYRKACAENKFESINFPVGHQFDLDMQEHAFNWFDSVLEPDRPRL